ncbi:MAG: hypothetical protein ACXAEN_24755 [Candidatus Thorarchaeota archaeon]
MTKMKTTTSVTATNAPDEKPGTHCGICGKPTKGDPHPGADVYHLHCIMEATKHLRERNDTLD